MGDAADASRGTLPWRKALVSAGLAALLVVAGYLGLARVGEALGGRLSPAQETRLLGGLSLPGAVPVAGRDPAEARLLRAWDRLLQRPGLLPLRYRLAISALDVPNAFALPGGSVGVTRGLLSRVSSEIGLALVLAHELGHHHHRHTVRRLGRVLAGPLVLSLVFGGDLHPAVSSLERLTESAYARDQEHEADAFGLRLVRDAYGTTVGALEFFENVAAARESLADRLGAFAATHPLTEERLLRLRALARALDGR